MAGIHALVAYGVNTRSREIGIRIALGAETNDVLRLAMWRAAGLVMTGLLIGLAGAALLTRCLSGLLYGISATDPATFVLVSIVLLATALLACHLSARRAARIDPMVTLRYE